MAKKNFSLQDKKKKELGKLIRELRESREMSLRSLAEAIGLPPSNLSYVEQGVKYGKGIVVSQEINKIVVKFNNNEATLFVHKMHSKFFTLEGGDEIINAMSEYADINARLKKLRNELKCLI